MNKPFNFYRLLIDMDVIVRRAACAADSKKGGDMKAERAKQNADSMLTNIFMRLKSTNHIGFLGTPGDRTQHRFKIFPAYKENRKNVPYPKYFYDVRNHLIENYNVEVVVGMEADDKLSIEQWKQFRTIKNLDEATTVICTIDKDLDIVPGWHYNFSHDLHYFMSVLDGLKCFYTQILKGDITDGIPRIIKGKNLTKWFDQIEFARSEEQLLDIVKDCMRALEIEEVDKTILERGQILFPLKEENLLWSIPK